MRRIDVQLGECDLNSLSAADFKRVTDVCGQPGTIDDETPPPKCRVTVAADKVTPHVARKVLKVEHSAGPSFATTIGRISNRARDADAGCGAIGFPCRGTAGRSGNCSSRNAVGRNLVQAGIGCR
jgi:hypothetical protein